MFTLAQGSGDRSRSISATSSAPAVQRADADREQRADHDHRRDRVGDASSAACAAPGVDDPDHVIADEHRQHEDAEQARQSGSIASITCAPNISRKYVVSASAPSLVIMVHALMHPSASIDLQVPSLSTMQVEEVERGSWRTSGEASPARLAREVQRADDLHAMLLDDLVGLRQRAVAAALDREVDDDSSPASCSSHHRRRVISAGALARPGISAVVMIDVLVLDVFGDEGGLLGLVLVRAVSLA